MGERIISKRGRNRENGSIACCARFRFLGFAQARKASHRSQLDCWPSEPTDSICLQSSDLGTFGIFCAYKSSSFELAHFCLRPRDVSYPTRLASSLWAASLDFRSPDLGPPSGWFAHLADQASGRGCCVGESRSGTCYGSIFQPSITLGARFVGIRCLHFHFYFQSWCVLFCSALFCSSLLCSAMLCYAMLCSVLFSSVSIPFRVPFPPPLPFAMLWSSRVEVKLSAGCFGQIRTNNKVRPNDFACRCTNSTLLVSKFVLVQRSKHTKEKFV